MDDGGDFEIEATDLRTGQAVRHPLAQASTLPHSPASTTASLPVPSTADASPDEFTVEPLLPEQGGQAKSYLPRWPRLPRAAHLAFQRARHLRGLLVGVVVLVIVGGLLLNLSAAQQGVGILRQPAT